ncbi:MAG: hypothetical protein OXE97_00505 [Gammaproteobacteria bacterium]|nr:hypothetical protein [Gammaproteobacteria bacterium]MCY4283212.1 hypothetical protein [Gammaproteobacteria bacterium]
MSSTALYRAFIDAGASEEKATLAAEDVVQVSQLPQLATKSDIAVLEANMATKADIADMATKADIADMATKADIAVLEANMATKADITDMATKSDISALEVNMAQREIRLIKWMVGSGLLYTGIIIAGLSLLT